MILSWIETSIRRSLVRAQVGEPGISRGVASFGGGPFVASGVGIGFGGRHRGRHSLRTIAAPSASGERPRTSRMENEFDDCVEPAAKTQGRPPPGTRRSTGEDRRRVPPRRGAGAAEAPRASAAPDGVAGAGSGRVGRVQHVPPSASHAGGCRPHHGGPDGRARAVRRTVQSRRPAADSVDAGVGSRLADSLLDGTKAGMAVRRRCVAREGTRLVAGDVVSKSPWQPPSRRTVVALGARFPGARGGAAGSPPSSREGCLTTPSYGEPGRMSLPLLDERLM